MMFTFQIYDSNGFRTDKIIAFAVFFLLSFATRGHFAIGRFCRCWYNDQKLIHSGKKSITREKFFALEWFFNFSVLISQISIGSA